MSDRMDAHGPGDRVEAADDSTTIFAALGIAESFMPESEAPVVDRDLLERLARRELPPDQAHLVCRLVAGFRSWHHAFLEILSSSSGPKQL